MAAIQDIAEKPVPVRCQRIGCDAMFTDDDNPEGSCQYHPNPPFFHDGMKEWSCCKKRSHDFSLFLAIPGCKTGKHTSEKPVIKAKPTVQRPMPTSGLISERNPINNKQVSTSCSRCRQGFFCSDHGSQPKPTKLVTPTNTLEKVNSPATRKIDLNKPITCRNKGCGKLFKEKDNHETACDYHPGPPVFHDRKRGWKCCDVYANEFNEFMTIPPCTKGWHNAEAT